MKKITFIIISLSAFLFDFLTKGLVKYLFVHNWHHSYVGPIIIPRFFELRYVLNPGLLFGLFQKFPPIVNILIMAISLIIFGIFVFSEFYRLRNIEKWSFALILGGGFGNLFDRILHGAVFDFLQIYIGRFPWPTFNFADALIDVGIGLLIISFFIGEKIDASDFD